MQVLCPEDVLKSHFCLRKKNIRQNEEFLAEYGRFDWESCAVVNHDDQNLVRNGFVSASLPQSSVEEDLSWCKEACSDPGAAAALRNGS